jgi:hypothetical protein
MNEISWHAFYQSELQSLYALLVVPVAFLAYRLVVPPEDARAEAPDAARFVAGVTLFFAIETMLDPLATGPLLSLAVVENTIASSLIQFLFVYLGDLRVLLLAIGVARPRRPFRSNLAWAAVATLIVPIWTGIGFAFARWLWPEVHGQLLWMLYELGFLALCIALGRAWVARALPGDPARAAYLRSIFGYSAAYYALWLAADLVIVVAGLDLGWALRMVPNQLYYAFWAPFAYWRFFSVRPS